MRADFLGKRDLCDHMALAGGGNWCIQGERGEWSGEVRREEMKERR